MVLILVGRVCSLSCLELMFVTLFMTKRIIARRFQYESSAASLKCNGECKKSIRKCTLSTTIEFDIAKSELLGQQQLLQMKKYLLRHATLLLHRESQISATFDLLELGFYLLSLDSNQKANDGL